MEHVSIDEHGSDGRTTDVQAHLSEALSLSDVAFNYFELTEGDSLSGGLHTHMNQEEIFVVLEGAVTFETPEETVEVGADEAIRFAPGEYQEGRNETGDRATVLALGAPQEQGETRTLLPCRECGADYHVVDVDGDDMRLECPDCGTEPAL